LSGYLNFTVQVTDSFGATASVAVTFWMYQHISFSGSALCRGSYVAACSASLTYSGGIPGGSPSADVVGFAQYCPSTFCYPTPVAVPPSFAVTVGAGSVTVSVPAKCGGGCPNGWHGIVYIRLTDHTPCAAGTNCTSPGSATFTIDIAGG
jgi:hypothetical protein